MKLLLKLLILSVPISFLLMFFILLTEDKSYPGADYDTYNFPKFELETLTGEKIFNSRIEGNDLS